LSSANDSLHLSRNHRELQKRELTDVKEQHEHKLRTLTREIEQLRERNLVSFLEKRQETIRLRRAVADAQRGQEEASLAKDEVKRLETELSVARSMKLFRDVAALRTALTERDKEIYMLREELRKTKEAQVMQTYTDAHIKSVENENTRLAKTLQTLQNDLLNAVRVKHVPLLENMTAVTEENKVLVVFWLCFGSKKKL
jgi:hypothetical protein